MRAIASTTATVVLIATLLLAAPHPAAASPLTHVVRAGENLYRIALRYGVTVEAIARANGLTDPERILPGQVLTIPDPGQAPEPRPSKKSKASKPAVPKAVTIARTYTVQRGDTLYAIARRYRTTVEALKAVNGLRSDLLQVGQRLKIPGRGEVASPRIKSVIQPVIIPPPPVRRTTEVLPAPEIGAQILAPQPLRVRRGPRSYFTTLALVAAETPLVILREADTWYEVQLPDGEVGWVHEDDLRLIERMIPVDPATIHGADIVREAMRYLGTPYRWGGSSDQNVDCSGFVFIVFNTRLPGLARVRSFDYFLLGAPVSGSDLLPGDLVFFTTYAPGPSHVGIYVGDGKFIHASSGARKVIISPLDDPYYAARYLGARRLLNP